MAKRVADVQITKDGIGEDFVMHEDSPQRATPEQLQSRK
jgi:nucleoporin NUP50-like protein